MRKTLFALLITVSVISCNKKDNNSVTSGQIYSGDPTATVEGSVTKPKKPKPKNYCENCYENETDFHYKCMYDPTVFGHYACEQWYFEGALDIIKNLNLSHSETTISPDINTVWCGEYRDSFLAQILGKGQDYGYYYYLLSKVAIDSGGLTISNAASHFAFANETVERFAVFSNGLGTDIPFSSGYASQAASWISYYRTKSSNPKFQHALDQMTADLCVYVGLTNNAIWALLP